MPLDNCPRDEAGFCRIALMGHRLCRPPGDCRVQDAAKAWEEVQQAAIRALSAKVKRQRREARR